jgi:hypothetical protein
MKDLIKCKKKYMPVSSSWVYFEANDSVEYEQIKPAQVVVIK